MQFVIISDALTFNLYADALADEMVSMFFTIPLSCLQIINVLQGFLFDFSVCQKSSLGSHWQAALLQHLLIYPRIYNKYNRPINTMQLFFKGFFLQSCVFI